MGPFDSNTWQKVEDFADPALTPEELEELEAADAMPWLCGSCGQDLYDAPTYECEHPWAHGDDVYK